MKGIVKQVINNVFESSFNFYSFVLKQLQMLELRSSDQQENVLDRDFVITIILTKQSKLDNYLKYLTN